MRLERKYVFHIPLFKYCGDELAEIDIDGILDDLIAQFSERGFESFYFSKVKSYYKSRCFDELLLTLFCDDDVPETIFRQWFRLNNDVLGQEAFAFECGNEMIVEKLDDFSNPAGNPSPA